MGGLAFLQPFTSNKEVYVPFVLLIALAIHFNRCLGRAACTEKCMILLFTCSWSLHLIAMHSGSDFTSYTYGRFLQESLLTIRNLLIFANFFSFLSFRSTISVTVCEKQESSHRMTSFAYTKRNGYIHHPATDILPWNTCVAVVLGVDIVSNEKKTLWWDAN